MNIDIQNNYITIASHFLITNDTSIISQTIIDGSPTPDAVFLNNSNDSTISIIGFTIQNGYTSDWDEGGGIRCENSTARLSHLIVRNNHARISGGIRCENSVLELLNVDLHANTSWGSSGSGGLGGGICCRSSDLLLKNVSIHHNFSDYEGGGLWNGGSTIVFDSIDLCNIYSNSALAGKDIVSDVYLNVVLDTFTVIQPTGFFASPIENFSFNILHGIIQQENADLYVSPNGIIQIPDYLRKNP